MKATLINVNTLKYIELCYQMKQKHCISIILHRSQKTSTFQSDARLFYHVTACRHRQTTGADLA